MQNNNFVPFIPLQFWERYPTTGIAFPLVVLPRDDEYYKVTISQCNLSEYPQKHEECKEKLRLKFLVK